MSTKKITILAVDDEADLLAMYQSVLKKDYNVLTAPSGPEALHLLNTEPIVLVLLDMRMPKMDGLEVLGKIKAIDPGIEVIMVTASKDIANAVEAMKQGAFDYVSKPFDVKELKTLIGKALEKSALVKENLYLKESLKEATSYCDLIGRSAPMQKLYKIIESVGPTDSTILIHGESGSGKELVARAIHQKSRRKDKPFVAVNCAALPDNLFESELFGHERGSFTGALERKIGKFELADGGTLFLDEIGCMSAAMQAKLLRVLEDKIVERVGGEKGIPIDIRIVSATNIDFSKHIEEEKFREDLFYRLNVIPIELPALKERLDDIPQLADYFLAKFNKQTNKKISGFTPAAFQAMQGYDWPGNVRELQNFIERTVVLTNATLIDETDLPFQNTTVKVRFQKIMGNLKDRMEEIEKETIKESLASNQGNITLAAKALKTARTSLISRMKTLGLNDAQGLN